MDDTNPRELAWVLPMLGLCLCILLLNFGYDQKSLQYVHFVSTSFVLGIILCINVNPYFDSRMQLFGVMEVILIAVGALVGGIIGNLLPKITSGVSLGFYLASFASSIMFINENTQFFIRDNNVLYLYVATAIVCVVLAQYYENYCVMLRDALAIGMIGSLSIDGFLQQSLKAFFSLSLLLQPFDSSLLCIEQCHVKLLIVIWCVFAGWRIANFENQIVKFLKAVLLGRVQWNNGYAQVSQASPADDSAQAAKQRTFSYPDTLIYNYIDPDDIPELLRPYAESIFTLAQSIMHYHGFQVDNSRNQSEHLIMLLFNETSSQDKMVSSAALRIHKRMFANYTKWCDRMGVRPLLLKDISPVKSHDLIIEDMLLFLLIWGESANLRLLPECLCFLFHKTMELHMIEKENTKRFGHHGKSKYPGFFLDMVVTPIYEVIAKSVPSSKDHADRKIYDDFNEFFWSTSCLQCRLHVAAAATIAASTGSNHADESLENGEHVMLLDENLPGNRDLAAALKSASKTYMEKRSWFHSLYSMSRIFEWHIITFSLLATWAFSNLLQWTYVFTLQVGSFVFCEITFFGILWACLEVWTLYPAVRLDDPTLFGFVLRISAGYLILCYQVVYFHWTFVSDPAQSSLKDLSLFAKGDSMFWWWQYVWLSLLSCSLYLLQSVLCYFPSIGSAAMKWRNDLWQALINIWFPFSQLYVGKDTSRPQSEVNSYVFFWLSLMIFKLWFGYAYVVSPVAVPTLELYDDYMNFNKLSFVKTFMLIFFWWLPHLLVYLIDLSIWYSVWASIAGGIVAISDRLGAVRDSSTLRAHFMRAPRLFYNSFMPSAQFTPSTNQNGANSQKNNRMKPHLSTLSLADMVAEPRKDTVGDSRKGKAPSADSSKSSHQSSYQQSGDIELRQMNDHVGEKLGGFEKRNREWVVFARVWNEVVSKLRERDLINNRELEILRFTNFEWLSKPTYLPLYQTAGCVELAMLAYKDASEEYTAENDVQLKMKIVETFVSSVGITAFEAVQEAWELFTWIMQEVLGPNHSHEAIAIVQTFLDWGNGGSLFGRFSGSPVKNLLQRATNITVAIKKELKSRRAAPVVSADMSLTAQSNSQQSLESLSAEYSTGVELLNAARDHSNPTGMKKSLSTGFLSALNEDQSAESSYPKMQPFRKNEGLVDHLRDRIREELKALLNDVKNALSDSQSMSGEVSAKITHILKNQDGFFTHDVYASKMVDLFCKDHRAPRALSKLVDLFTLRVTQVELKSLEANRRLNFFLNSLYMEVPRIPMMRYCREYTCITPYYSEDILLTPSDLQATNSDNVSVILYLQTIYKNDWINFLERLGIDESAIWSPAHVQELRMWASCRAQTLYRTVEGMMYTESAIRLLAELESLNSVETELMAKLKFNYVVACQVYGVFKKTQDRKADDIDFLLCKYPNLRVAYIDTHKMQSEVAHYSVLIKCEPLNHKSVDPAAHGKAAQSDKTSGPEATIPIKQRIKEVFRVKLPGNPVLGEGKPENQNHAIIFTRGRYLQAIDMNQDGYFEEALKMRNLLQEFQDDTAIVGFREHIFTGQVSSVANYMALQELSFVTLGQRVLTRPLHIRQHYGHPDLFDKLFVMTEGGMSKASRGINLSEDVFAGFNATIRGHGVNFIEYVQVGKGRDVGLQQTYKFEAKLSQGNAEQSISRDLSRLGQRLDFFRLMSFYFGGIGHYLSNTLVMFTLVIIVYTMLALALYGEEGVNGRPIHPEGNFQLLLAGMGILQTLPLAITLIVEKGFRRMFSEISFMMLSGGPLYFIFHIQTKCYYFSQTLLAGGAKYRPTGRGFVTRHSPFEENYRFFASSHIYFGFELLVALILFGVFTTSKQYAGLTWSLWLASISFLMGPFWFNPLSFEWTRITEDYNSWMRWMMEHGGDSDQSWETWWREENSFYPKLSSTWKGFLVLQKCVVWVLIAVGVAGQKFFQDVDEQKVLLQAVGVLIAYFVVSQIVSKFEREWTYPTRRFVSLVLSSVVAICICFLMVNNLKLFRYSLAMYYFLSALCFFALMLGMHGLVMPAYKFHDYLVGNFLFIIHTIACVCQLGYLQTWLLYHNALSRGVEIDHILQYARKNKEKAAVDSETVAELRNRLAEQEKRIQELLSHDQRARSNGAHHGNSNGHVLHEERSSLMASAPAGSSYGAVLQPTDVRESHPHKSQHQHNQHHQHLATGSDKSAHGSIKQIASLSSIHKGTSFDNINALGANAPTVTEFRISSGSITPVSKKREDK